MSTKNKKNIASQALLEMESLKDSIKEESKNTLKSMLADVVKDVLRESVEEDEEEKDYEVVDDEKNAEDSDDKDTKDSEKSGEVSEDDAMSNEEEPVDGMDQGAAEAPEMGQEGDMNQPVDAQEASEESGEGEDEWDNYSQYQVGDNTYDLTGEEDYDQIVKVYKLMKDEDQVVVKKDGSTLQLQDNGTGAEYVIDLGTDDDMVYTLTLNTGGTYRIASTTSAKGTYQQNGRNITFEKKNFMSDFYAYIEKGTISESGLYMTVPVKSVGSVGGSNDMFTIKLYRKLQ